jgi:hypothetical protein
MYKPWPKCPICSSPLHLSARAETLTDGQVRSIFECEHCGELKPKPKQPITPFNR